MRLHNSLQLYKNEPLPITVSCLPPARCLSSFLPRTAHSRGLGPFAAATPNTSHFSWVDKGRSSNSQPHSALSVSRGGSARCGPWISLVDGGLESQGSNGGRFCGPCDHHRMMERLADRLCRTVPACILLAFVTIAVPALPSTSYPSCRPTPSIISSLRAEPGRLRHIRSMKGSTIVAADPPSGTCQASAFLAARLSGTTLKQCVPGSQSSR